MLSTFILSERDLHDNELVMIVRSDTLHGPTSRSTVEHPIARLARWTGPVTQRSVENAFEAIFLKEEEEEKALMDAAAATAASMAHQDEVAASSTNPDTAAHPGTVPMNVEFPKEAVVPETSTGGAASSSIGQFVDTPGGMEISEADLKRREFEEVPESRKVRRSTDWWCALWTLWVQRRLIMTIPSCPEKSSSGRLTKSRTRCIRTKANR